MPTACSTERSLGTELGVRGIQLPSCDCQLIVVLSSGHVSCSEVRLIVILLASSHGVVPHGSYTLAHRELYDSWVMTVERLQSQEVGAWG